MKVYNFQNPQSRPPSPRQKYGFFNKLDKLNPGLKVAKKYSKPKKNNTRDLQEPRNTFYFQILGIALLSFAIVVFFQTVLSASQLSASAQISSDYQSKEVRLLTNFQTKYNPSNSAKSTLADIPQSEPQPEPATPTVTPTSEQKYTVIAGDNLYNLASRFKLEYSVLAEANNLQSPYTLQVGQELVIPSSILTDK